MASWKYISTRGQTPPVHALDTIRLGIAPDGGLFVPADWPHFDLDEILSLTDLSYPERAARIMQPFLPDLPAADLTQAVKQAYDPRRWEDARVAPLHPLDSSPVAILELWHGPTCAFKDVALQLLPHLLKRAVAIPATTTTATASATANTATVTNPAAAASPGAAEIVILVATSGDTGKAALAGFAGVAGTRIIVFYPAGGVSPVQERQMTTQAGGNVHVVGVEGNFDDAQAGVKRLFTDSAFQAQLAAHHKALSSANSINWGRLLPQIVYYVSAYLDLVQQGRVHPGESINVAVPTGNFGNILAAHYARRVGVPIARLICASNRNNILTDFFHTGRYDRQRPFYRTSSPSMDILVSSNLERLLFELVNEDSAPLRTWMDALRNRGVYEIPTDLIERVHNEFWADWASEEQTQQAMARIWQQHHYLIDPHTAVAVHVYDQYKVATGDERPTVIVSTASPFKFARVVARALGLRPSEPSDWALLPLLAAETGWPIPPSLQGLDQRPVLHTLRCKPNQMAAIVASLTRSLA